MRGLHDIKTHGTLARNGVLVSVARDLHTVRRSEHCESGEAFADNWNVQRHIWKKGSSVRKFLPAVFPGRDINMAKRINSYQNEVIRDFLQEMRRAAAEGISISVREFARLTKRLAELEAESKVLQEERRERKHA